MVGKTEVFRDSKLKLRAKPLAQGDGVPTMSLQFYRANVGLAVYTATERDPDQKKWINASMDYFSLGSLFEIIRAYAGYGPLAGQLPSKGITIENYNTVDSGDGNKSRQLVSFTEVGLDDEDVMFIRVLDVDQARPMITFPFHNDYWHVFKDTATGQPLTPQRMSRLAALSTVNTWSDLIPDAVFEEFCNGKAAANGVSGGENAAGGNGGNGYQNNSNGYQKKPWNNNGGGGWKQNNGGGGYQKKPWNNNGGGNGGGGWNNGQKKQWNNNGGGNGGGGWKQNNGGGGGYQNNNGGGGYSNNQNNGGGNGGGGNAGGNNPSLSDDVPF